MGLGKIGQSSVMAEVCRMGFWLKHGSSRATEHNPAGHMYMCVYIFKLQD